MGEVVNLNRARKVRMRQEEERTAAANRVRHGRTRVERENDRRARDTRERLLDGVRRDEDKDGQ